MKPIFFFTHEYAPFRGGVATYVEECATAARRLGYDVRIITASGGHRRGRRATAGEPQESAGDPVVWRVPSSGRLTPLGVLTLARGLYRKREAIGDAPLVALSAGAHMALILMAWSGLYRPKRVLNFFHGSEILKLTCRWPWRWLAPAFYRKRLHFAAASRYVCDLLRRSGLCPPDAPIHLAPCAPPPDLLSVAGILRSSLENAKADPAAARQSFRILTVARIHPRKGQADFARAMARLPERLRRRLRYQLVGTGDDRYLREIVAICQAAQIAVEHLPRVENAELPTLYAACDLFALTSRALADSVEGFGIVYLEAAAFGRPVLAYASGGVSEAVHDHETGLLVSEGDIDGLAHALEKLMQDDALRQRLGRAGCIFARSFSWETAARVLCEAALALPTLARRIPNSSPTKLPAGQHPPASPR